VEGVGNAISELVAAVVSLRIAVRRLTVGEAASADRTIDTRLPLEASG
jgi:hypothetical protein